MLTLSSQAPLHSQSVSKVITIADPDTARLSCDHMSDQTTSHTCPGPGNSLACLPGQVRGASHSRSRGSWSGRRLHQRPINPLFYCPRYCLCISTPHREA
ncbi:hypothetical protein ElyMa_001134600 [Elysia marginata]|uniref:Uncharacterized protein n=1 Tax=Elysia marginata TaxID=1093978 RepID=A0AAV4HZ48_9GAST|nr:hypothetical protein ElyMa_001134600 [Elysia marginata]